VDVAKQVQPQGQGQVRCSRVQSKQSLTVNVAQLLPNEAAHYIPQGARKPGDVWAGCQPLGSLFGRGGGQGFECNLPIALTIALILHSNCTHCTHGVQFGVNAR
jgi:hypothetical protein